MQVHIHIYNNTFKRFARTDEIKYQLVAIDFNVQLLIST